MIRHQAFLRNIQGLEMTGVARPGTPSPSTLGAAGSAEALQALLDALAMACRAVKLSNRMIQYGVSVYHTMYYNMIISIYI